MNCTRTIWRKGWIHPFLQIIVVQNSPRGKELNPFYPPNSSDDLCILFCRYPSSLTEAYYCTVYMFSLSSVQVVKEYSFIISLEYVYGRDINAGGFVNRDPDDRPEVGSISGKKNCIMVLPLRDSNVGPLHLQHWPLSPLSAFVIVKPLSVVWMCPTVPPMDHHYICFKDKHVH